jgi:hypothetical protein
MPDIDAGDFSKRMFRLALWWLRRKFIKMKERHDIHDDMVNCGNGVFRYFIKLIYDISGNIKEKYQKAVAIDIPEVILWWVYKDTAYRDPFFWALKNILDHKEELYPTVMKYYKEPEEWYINGWTESKDRTAEMLKDGRLREGELSPDENVWVPQYQYKKIYDRIEKETKKEKTKRGW